MPTSPLSYYFSQSSVLPASERTSAHHLDRLSESPRSPISATFNRPSLQPDTSSIRLATRRSGCDRFALFTPRCSSRRSQSKSSPSICFPFLVSSLGVASRVADMVRCSVCDVQSRSNWSRSETRIPGHDLDVVGSLLSPYSTMSANSFSQLHLPSFRSLPQRRSPLPIAHAAPHAIQGNEHDRLEAHDCSAAGGYLRRTQDAPFADRGLFDKENVGGKELQLGGRCRVAHSKRVAIGVGAGSMLYLSLICGMLFVFREFSSRHTERAETIGVGYSD